MDDHWYPVLKASRLGRKPQRVMLLGEALVLFRGDNGPAALRDMCPHRAASLSRGAVRGGDIECPYHGWRFDGQGACTHVPAFAGEVPNRRVRAWDVTERHGLIFVCRDRRKAAQIHAPVWDGQPAVSAILQSRATTTLADAVENVLDPIHTLFVHKGLIRGAGGAAATRVTLSAGIESGALVMRYSGEERQAGLLSRLLESSRQEAVSRFLRPGVVSLEYRGRDRLNLVTTLYFTPEDALTFKGFAVMTGPRQGGLGYLKALAFLAIMRRVIAQDLAVMKDATDNWVAAGRPAHANAPQEVLRPLIERVVSGEAGDVAARSVTLNL